MIDALTDRIAAGGTASFSRPRMETALNSPQRTAPASMTRDEKRKFMSGAV